MSRREHRRPGDPAPRARYYATGVASCSPARNGHSLIKPVMRGYGSGSTHPGAWAALAGRARCAAQGCPPPRRPHSRVRHPGRASGPIYDYWLGGKDNFEADRIAGEETIAAWPAIRASARANRAFLARTVRYLAAEAGIRQFLDIGTGLPTASNTHEVAQAVAPECRIVYVDNDPLVLSHARALLASGPEGVTAYLDADLRDTAVILEKAAETLDFTQPVAIMLLAILHYIPDLGEAQQIVAHLVSGVPPGSYLAISHCASDIDPVAMAEMIRRMNEHLAEGNHVGRTREEVTRFFDGLDLVDPGVQMVTKWRPASEMEASGPTSLWGGVARKPSSHLGFP